MTDPAGTKPDAAGPPDAPPPPAAADPYAAAKATLRDTLKWLATTFAAVVGVVMAGASLTGIGKLARQDQTLALLAGGGGLFCIVAATGVMLYLLLPRNFYFGELLEPKNRKLLDRLNQHVVEILPPEFDSVDQFIARRDKAVQAIRDNRDRPASDAYNQGAAFLDDYYDDIVRLSYFAHYELMRTSVHRAQWVLLVLGTLAISGLGFFAVQIGSAKDPAKPPAPLIANVTLDVPRLHPTLQTGADTQGQSLSVILNAALEAGAMERDKTKPSPSDGRRSALAPLLALIQSLVDAGAMPKGAAIKLSDELIKNSVEGGKEIFVDAAKAVIKKLFDDPSPQGALMTVNVPACGCPCASTPSTPIKIRGPTRPPPTKPPLRMTPATNCTQATPKAP